MSVRQRCFALDDQPEGAVLGAILESGRYEIESRAQEHRVLLDTFDWRVLRAGATLDTDVAGTVLALRDAETGDLVARQPAAGIPSGRDTLGSGPVADRLSRALDVRALLPLLDVDVTTTTLRRLDGEGKTVVRLCAETLTVAVTDPPYHVTAVRVVPLRGYERAAVRAADELERSGLVAAAHSPSFAALVAAGLEPGRYTGRIQVDLDPDAPSAVAYRAVLAALLDAVEANRRGTIDDTDPEFLHDLRVAVRRARTIARAATGVLPDPHTAGLAADLRWLAAQTGRARDLDVWLLGWDDLVAALPETDAVHVHPLLVHLSSERAREQHRLADVIASADLDALLARWRNVVESHERGPDGERATSEVAVARTQRALHTVLTHGARVRRSSPSEALHDLRKRAKRLRYLVECFGAVLDPAAVRALAPDLRRLQDVLGAYQDRSVQIAELREWADVLGASGEAKPATILAMGVLVARCERERDEIRRAYRRRFRAFRATAREHPIAAR